MRRRSLLLLVALMVSVIGYSQGSLVFHEDFEMPSQADSVTSAGPTGWNVGSALASQGTYSDSAHVSIGGVNTLTTQSFDLTGMNYAVLNFDHIAKVEFFDSAMVEVSIDNGSSWIQLTNAEYKGNSSYFSNNGCFNANAYTKWQPMDVVSPDNSWWKSEEFDLSSVAANAANVKVRFVLKDGNNETVFENIGWFIDNISVTGAVDELVPPSVSLESPVVEDTVYNTGPFQVKATITDNSGIDTAFIVYNVNGGTDDTTGMIASANNLYAGEIPSQSLDDSISYEIVAIDLSQASNKTTAPQTRKSFIILPSPPPAGCTSPVTSFPLTEDFDALSKGSDDCGNINPLGISTWENEDTNDDTDWIPWSGSTVSGSTGPSSDNTSGSGRYLFIEASSCADKVAILNSACIDLSNETLPVLEFAYHMHGSAMGSLDVEIYYGGKWTNIYSISGDQGDKWHTAMVDLSNYKLVTQLRIVGHTGSSYTSDMAIDDIRIYTPPANDAALMAINEPVDPTLSLTGNDINVAVKNAGSADITSLDFNYSINGGAVTTYNWTGNILPQDQVDSLVIGTENFTVGNNTIEIWTSNPNNSSDADNTNDTLTRDFYVCDGTYSGVYDIGGSGADFQDIQEAVNALEICGISGPVTFNIASGTYTGQYEIGNISGASATNTITFQSQTGNADDVVFEFDGGSKSSDNYIFKLDAADYFVFSKITVNALSTKYAIAFSLENGADYNTIDNCIVNATPYSSTSTYSFFAAPVYVDGANGHNTFSNNEFIGGTYGIAFEDAAGSNQVLNNSITGFHFTGVYAEDQDSMIVQNNIIENGTTAGICYGIRLDGNTNFGLVEGNRVHVHSSGSSTNCGLFLDEIEATATDSFVVANNFIRQSESDGNNVYGIRLTETDYVKLVHNTVKIEGTSSSATAIYIFESTYSPSAVGNDFINNNFVNVGGGTAIEISEGAGANNMINTIDHNNYYATSGNLMEYDGLFRSTITQIQSSTGQDANSLSVDPIFSSPDDPYVFSASLDGAAMPLSYISVDIDDEPRSSTPDIGADEFSPAANDVSVAALTAPEYTCSGAQSDVKVRMLNLGTADLTSGTIHWTINGAAQNNINFNATLASGMDSVISLGSYTFNYGTSYELKAWLDNPNGVADENHSNDTLVVDVAPGLPAGTYTVGGPNADFDSLNHAADYLTNHGVCGAVTFEINSGTYEDRMLIQSVTGADQNNTITITSASGDSTDVTIKYAATANDNYVIGVYNTPNVSVSNMTIQSLDGTYGHAVVFDDGSHNFTLNNNIILGDSTSSTSELAALVYSDDGNAIDSNAVISNNMIRFGSYGIFIGGESSISGLEMGAVINNNHMINNTRGGAYMEYFINADFSGNIIENYVDEADYIGAEFYHVDESSITKNKIYTRHGESAVKLNYVEGVSANYALIANNFFSANDVDRVVHINSSDYIDFYYNSVSKFGSVESPSMFVNSGDDLELMNNAIINNSGAPAIDLNYFSNNPLANSDYNDLFTTGTVLIDNDGTDVSTLTDWKSAGFDANSVSANPYYTEGLDLRTGISALDNAGTPISSITTDIDGETRDATTPDIGADEYAASGLDLTIAEVFSPVSGCDLGSETVEIAIHNIEVKDVTSSFTVGYKIVGDTNVVTENINTPLVSGDTLNHVFSTAVDLSSSVDSAFEIKVWVNLPADALPANDTMMVTVKNTMTPSDPVTASVDVPWNTSTKIGASSPYTIRWFENLSDTVAIHIGDSLNTPVLTDSTTYYVDAVNGEGKLLFTDICQYLSGDGENDPMFPYLVDDMMEITNVGQVPVDLTGYSVDIHTSSDHSGNLPSITLKPGEILLLSFDSDESPANNMYGLNTSASVTSSASAGYILRDNAGNILDVVALNGYTFDSSTGVTSADWSGNIPSSSGHSGVIRVNADNNSASDWIVAEDSQPQTLGIENPGLKADGVTCNSGRVPIKVNVTNIPLQNAAVADVTSPAGGCGLSDETVSVQIYNFGYDPINGNLDAKYSIRGSSNIVSEAVTAPIAKNDTITYTFNTPVDLSTNVDSNFIIDVWVELQNDNVTSDDSTSIAVFSGASQSSPVVSDITVPYGQSGTLVASSPYNIYWYADAGMTQKLHEGSSFDTPILYDTASYYVVAQDLIPDTLTASYSGSQDYDGVMFDIVAKNSVVLDSFAVSFTNPIGRDVDVYYGYGTSEQLKDNRALFTHAGTVTLNSANAQGSPTYIPVGNIDVAAGDTVAIYIRDVSGDELRVDNSSSTHEDSNIRLISGYGVFNSGNAISGKGFNGEIFYSLVNGCPSLPVEAKAIVQNVPANDAGVAGLIMPSGGTFINQPFEVKAVLQNFGQDTLTSVDIDWTINGSAQQTFNWTGTILPSGGVDTVVISNNTSLNYDHYDIKAWVNNPNGTADLVNTNDTTTYLDFVPCIDQGIYTIDATNGDFTSFADASEALNNCGINGAVTFDVAAGTYHEQMSLDQIAGASANNTVTFQSASGNAVDVVLSFADTSATTDNYVVNLDGTDHVSFLNMTLRAEGPDDAKVVTADNGNRNITFDGNIIEGVDTASMSLGFNLVDIGHENDSAWVFRNNEFLYGSDAINYYGGYVNHAYRMHIENNMFSNQSSGAIYLSNIDSVNVHGNTIKTNRQESSYRALNLSYVENGLSVTANNMYAPSAEIMVDLSYCDQTSSDKGMFANNMIQSDVTTTSYSNALVELYNSNNLDVVFNTMKFAANSGEILYLFSSDNITLKNNIYASVGETEIIYVSSSSNLTSDYNVYWAPVATSYGYWTTSVDNLSEIQTETGQDMNSFVADPMFVASDDLHITNLDLFLAGTPIAGITTDIDGETRQAAPTIGADEYMPANNDAALTVFDGPVNPLNTGSNDIYVTIKNYGSSNLTSADIAWSVDGVAQTTYNWTGNLATGTSEDSVLIGSYNFVPGIKDVKAWIASANNAADGNNLNDTIQATFVSCANPLSGTYTIGGSSSDYATIEQAIIALENCGVSGAVVMEVASGNYTGNYSLGVVPGASASNTVTFTSQTGKASDVILSYAPSSSTDNYTFRLDGSAHVIIRDMTIRSTGANYGIALQLADSASYNKVENMIVHGVDIDDDDEKFAAIYVGPGQAGYNEFSNNEVHNGAAGFYIDGGSLSTAGAGNMIDSNIIHGFYKYATYVRYNDSIMIRNNHMENDPNSSYVYTVRLYNVEGGSEITGNYIRGNGSSVYPLYLYYMNKNSTTPALVANNMIVNDDKSSGGHGIFINFSAYLDIYYNTVAIYGGSAMEAFRINISSTYADANSIDVRNNNFVSMSGGAIYDIDEDAINSNMFSNFDFNNAYTTGSVLGTWGNSDAADMTEWKNISLMEAHSISVDPWFVSKVDAHANSPVMNASATPIAAVTTDFDGDVRDANNPDIGADEYTPIPVDMGVVEILEPARTFAPIGFVMDVEVAVKNFGADTMYSYDVEYVYDGQNPVVQTVNDTVAPGEIDTVKFNNSLSTVSGYNLLEIYTSVPSDGKLSNDTMSIFYQGLPTVTPEWNNDVEGPVHFAHDGTPDVWERGMPMGKNITTAHSGANVWMTDLDAEYSSNTDAFLYTPMIDFSGIYDANMEFWHTLDTEQGLDGATIEFSLNGGVSWNTLGDTASTGNKTNWYHDVIGNMPVWTGSFGWTKSTFELSQFDNHPTPVQFRFKFYSDAQNHGDGWAIDDFAITLPTYPKDAGVVDINQPSDTTIIGDQVTVEVDIMNFGSDTLYDIPVSYEVNGNVETETWTGTLHPNDTATFAFAASYASPNSSYVLKSYTELPNDGNAANDTTDALLNVSQPPLDAGITAIIQPDDTTTQFVSTNVTVRIRNFGIDTLTSIPVEYQQGSLTPVSETWTGNLAAGDSVDYTFSTPFTSGAGSFSLCATTDLPGDYDTSNDEVCKTIIATNVEENSIFGNVSINPNPADEYTTLNLNNNVRGDIIISVTDVAGNVVYSKHFDLIDRTNSIRIETENLPAGMYFINLQSVDDNATMKLIIKH